MQDADAYPEWIIGYDTKMDHQYMIHTRHPRFICTIDRHPYLSGTDYLYELNNNYVLHKFSWLDQAPDLEQDFILLMVKAEAAYEEFDIVDISVVEYEAQLPPMPLAPSLN
ncbi:hypothetical protein ACFL6E_03355 [Candidatus Neomarinimicrobiota bacterium]